MTSTQSEGFSVEYKPEANRYCLIHGKCSHTMNNRKNLKAKKKKNNFKTNTQGKEGIH